MTSNFIFDILKEAIEKPRGKGIVIIDGKLYEINHNFNPPITKELKEKK